MKKISLIVILSWCAFINAQVKGLEGFKKYKAGYTKTFFTMEEAIKTYCTIVDLNGVDTLKSTFTRDDNPVVFSFFKSTPESKKVNVGSIIYYDGVYDVLFLTIKDEDTQLFDVIDSKGERVTLFYRKPKN